MKLMDRHTRKNARTLLEMDLDRKKLARRPLPYEQLDQLVFDLLAGVR